MLKEQGEAKADSLTPEQEEVFSELVAGGYAKKKDHTYVYTGGAGQRVFWDGLKTAVSKLQRILPSRLRKKPAVIWGFAVVAIVFLLFVWPTAYRYEKVRIGNSEQLWKINRVTGSATEIYPVHDPSPPKAEKRLRDVRLRDVTSAAVVKCEIQLTGYRSPSYFEGTIYNGWQLSIKRIVVRIKTKYWSRDYDVDINAPPLASTKLPTIWTYDQWETPWSFSIVSLWTDEEPDAANRPRDYRKDL